MIMGHFELLISNNQFWITVLNYTVENTTKNWMEEEKLNGSTKCLWTHCTTVLDLNTFFLEITLVFVFVFWEYSNCHFSN